MTIETTVKQNKPFRTPYQKIIVNLLLTGNWIKNENSKFLKEFEITHQQYNILRILRGLQPKPASINLLIEKMLDKMSNASRLVDKLHNKGFAERRNNPLDRRSCDVIITPKGLKLLQKIDEQRLIWEESLKTISPDEAEQLSNLLDKLRGDDIKYETISY